jgi:glycosyltransferase involved in cell wall biosynthesis
MRIGIARSLTDSISGGVFQYEIVLLKALGEIAANFTEELVYLCYHPNDLSILAGTSGLSYRGIRVLPVGKSANAQASPPEKYLAQKPATPPPLDSNDVKFNYAGGDGLRQDGVELLFLLSPNLPAFSFRLPYVVPIFDLNHRLQPEFPEVSAFGETNIREYFYINTCRFATLVLVDSEVGKSDVLRFYGDLIDEDRIRILPYYPPIKDRALPSPQDLDRVRAKYNLPKRYFFYPAQFWPHKNHALIVQAIKLIADKTGEVVPVVFSGAYWTYIMASNFKEVMALAAKLGVGNRIRYLGSVPDEDMAALYTLSAGLVMPTFFGPTNIPPIEAWHFGRPVITSDITGMREQSGDAGLLIDPRSPQALAEAMKRIWLDEAFSSELVARGRARLTSYDWNTFVAGVAAILTEAAERVRAGRTPRYPAANPTAAAAAIRT